MLTRYRPIRNCPRGCEQGNGPSAARPRTSRSQVEVRQNSVDQRGKQRGERTGQERKTTSSTMRQRTRPARHVETSSPVPSGPALDPARPAAKRRWPGLANCEGSGFSPSPESRPPGFGLDPPDGNLRASAARRQDAGGPMGSTNRHSNGARTDAVVGGWGWGGGRRWRAGVWSAWEPSGPMRSRIWWTSWPPPPVCRNAMRKL